MLQTLGQHRINPLGGLRDERGVRGVPGDRTQRVADLHDPPVNDFDQDDQQAEQGGHRDEDDSAAHSVSFQRKTSAGTNLGVSWGG